MQALKIESKLTFRMFDGRILAGWISKKSNLHYQWTVYMDKIFLFFLISHEKIFLNELRIANSFKQLDKKLGKLANSFYIRKYLPYRSFCLSFCVQCIVVNLY